MEIYELRYFMAVAQFENLHRASEKIRVSPASLSKAISRMESELQSSLFVREGRGIRLTDEGRLLKIRASQILQLEESARLEIAGSRGRINVVIAGPEILLARMGLDVSHALQNAYPEATFEFQAGGEALAMEKVAQGDAHLALATTEVPPGLTAKPLGEANFVTVVGRGHALYRFAKAGKSVAVEEVLRHPFVSPSHPILGKVGLRQSLDGWRDDRFMRQIPYRTTSLKLLEEFVTSGRALAYLPDYHVEKLDVLALNVTGCPFSCLQKVKLVARRPEEKGWLNSLF